jgi:hypothetical protein
MMKKMMVAIILLILSLWERISSRDKKSGLIKEIAAGKLPAQFRAFRRCESQNDFQPARSEGNK